MSVAEILREYGFVPSIPTQLQQAGTPGSLMDQHVPGIPPVPTSKTDAGSQSHAEHPLHRQVMRFRKGNDAWATALGAPGMTAAALVADILERWPGAEVEGSWLIPCSSA
jgi:hypothetical protein